MTPHSKARLDIGARLASSFVTVEAVRAVFAFGSAGNGFADEFSDLELGIIWEREPDSRELEEVVRRAGGGDWVYQGFDEQKLSSGGSFRFSGLKVEPANWTVAVVDRIIEDVMVRYDVSQNMISSFKWARHYLADASILPDSCFERLDALFDTNLSGVVEIYDALAQDVFLLVARHRSEIDLSEFRSRLNEPMPVWKG